MKTMNYVVLNDELEKLASSNEEAIVGVSVREYLGLITIRDGLAKDEFCVSNKSTTYPYMKYYLAPKDDQLKEEIKARTDALSEKEIAQKKYMAELSKLKSFSIWQFLKWRSQ